MGEANNTTTPSIYVACLAAYKSGYLHGAWIDAGQDDEAIRAEIESMLTRSPIASAEEYAIHDYEGFESLCISEYEGIASVVRKARFIAEHGALGAAVADHFGGDLDEAEEALTDHYHGQFASLADYVQELTEDTISIPESLRYYIDWEAMAWDAHASGDLFFIETMHVFSGH